MKTIAENENMDLPAPSPAANAMQTKLDDTGRYHTDDFITKSARPGP
jgi:hypothetical protein